ncbi:MAG: cob(I)yrinic acid a,c-diamide adenosyltransferase [Planctomycetota bacterium]
MVRLTRIYTRTGDDGTTGLGDGSRVPKTSARIEAYGTVDELNALLGLCHEHLAAPVRQAAVRQIQNDLFDLGADLCVPEGARPGGQAPLRIGPQRVLRLERWIDETNAALAPLQSFVLPGGGPANTMLHLARTVCRRAERRVQALSESEPVNVQCGIYLNRLSDLLFVMARAAVVGPEVLWSPCRDDAPSSPA